MKDMADNLTIKEITQEADTWLKQMYYSGGELLENLRKAFHAEKASDPPRALSQEKREYYMVYADQDAELLAGINSQSCDISSVAKVVPKDKSKARGRDCVRKLIEEILVNKCKIKGRDSFSVVTNGDGKRVFEYLKKNLPKGIKEIKSQQTIPCLIPGQDEYYRFTLFIADQSWVKY
jgi:hypothetical protein